MGLLGKGTGTGFMLHGPLYASRNSAADTPTSGFLTLVMLLFIIFSK